MHPFAWNDQWFGRRPHGVLPQRQETFGDDRAKTPASRGPAHSTLVLRRDQRHALRRPRHTSQGRWFLTRAQYRASMAPISLDTAVRHVSYRFKLGWLRDNPMSALGLGCSLIPGVGSSSPRTSLPG